MIQLWQFFKALPTIITFVLQVKKWVDKEKDLNLRKKKLGAVSDAFKKAHQEGTSDAIENLFVKPDSK